MDSTLDEKALLSQKRKRILDDQECRVCGDQSTGKHYGVYSCDGCSGFFKRTSRRTEPWVCKSQGTCDVDKNSRNECKSCRLHKCLGAGMSMEGVLRRSRLHVASGSFDETFSKTSMNTTTTDQEDQSNKTTNQNTDSQSNNVESIHRPLSALNTPLNTSNVVIKSETTDKPEVQVQSAQPRDPKATSKRSLNSPIIEKQTMATHQPHVHTTIHNSTSEAQKVTRALFVNAFSRESQPENTLALSTQRSRVITTTHAQTQNQGVLNGTASQQNRMESRRCSLHELIKAVEPVHFHSTENIQDAAMRLMTASIRFARNLPCFTRIPFRDQIILLEESWKKLFLLDAAYWALPLEVTSLLNVGGTGDSCTAGRQSTTEIRTVQELLTYIRSFCSDLTELACLKAIIIFRPETKGLKDAETVDKIQDEIQLLLSGHLRSLHPNHPTRFGKLLLSLLAVQSVAEKPIEEVLFRISDDKDIFETLLSKLIDS